LDELVGVILAAGRGKRMGTLGDDYPKALLPVANEPVIGHHLRLLCSLGVRRVFVVVGFRGLDIAQAIGKGQEYGTEVTYIEQGPPLGSAYALARVMPYINGPFFLTLGDYFFALSDPERMRQRLQAGESAIAAKREPERRLIVESCELRVDGDNRINRITEKPRSPVSDLKGCGFYALQPEVLDAVARTPRTALRDEYEIMGSLDLFVQDGFPLYAEEIIAWDRNFTRPEDVLAANLEWLDRGRLENLVHPLAQVEPGAQLSRAMVARDAQVAAGTHIQEVVVFPETRLNGGARLRRAVVTPRAQIACA